MRWLNDSSEPGKRGWDAAYPRTVEIALFAVRSADPESNAEVGRVRVLNAHFDHVGIKARSESAMLIGRLVAASARDLPNVPQVLCGDFNSAKGGNTEYAHLTLDVGLQDTARCAASTSLHPSTFHKFQGPSFHATKGDGTVKFQEHSQGGHGDARHIDWVLWRNGLDVCLEPRSFRVLTDTLPNGRWPSDHFPIAVRFALAAALDSPVRSKL